LSEILTGWCWFLKDDINLAKLIDVSREKTITSLQELTPPNALLTDHL